MIPYGRHSVDQTDVDEVLKILQSDWLTTGPMVQKFEQSIAGFCGAVHGVAVSSGTAALHCAVYAAGISRGDEVIIPAITFAATANCILFQGGMPVVVDVEPDTLLMDTAEIEASISTKTKAIIAVDYAGQPCDYETLRKLADKHDLILISDSCHALGAIYHRKPVSQYADLTAYSFHPVKHVTTGEGGMVVTGNDEYAAKMKRFRNHCISTDLHERQLRDDWRYEIIDIGYNFRLTDFQCALGLSQFRKLNGFLQRRREIAHMYDHAFEASNQVRPLKRTPDTEHAYHLYVVRVGGAGDGSQRSRIFTELRSKGIGVNVHYIPLNHHSFYRKTLGIRKGQFPSAEAAYRRILSLPIFPGLKDDEVNVITDAVNKSVSAE